MCGTDVNENVSTMLSNAWSCLATNGYLLVFSYGPPEERVALLDGQATSKEPLFDIKVMVFNKPSLKVALEGGDQAEERMDEIDLARRILEGLK